MPLAEALRPMHERWLREAKSNLAPAGPGGESTIWTRWGAVRYLADQFNYHYGWESRLLDQIAPQLPAGTAARLLAEREVLDQLRAQLDVIGRRQGTAAPMAALAQAFIERLSSWCAELEQETAHLQLGDLEDEALETLALLEMAPLNP
jgi:hypothetical protein